MPRTRVSRPRRSLLRPRLLMESLEDRLAPATLTVNSIVDTATAYDPYLSLRETIALVNSVTVPTRLCTLTTNQISGTLHARSGRDMILLDPAKATMLTLLGGSQLERTLPRTTATLTIGDGTPGFREA